MYIRTVAFYSISFFFIFCWWMIAYRNHEADEPKSKIPSWIESSREIKKISGGIDILPRETLIEALLGNTSLMGELILKWDIDAQILEQDGHQEIKRLTPSKFLQSQKIYRALSQNLEDICYTHDIVIDDMGIPFDITLQRKKIVPQTYMAAEVLLALKEPSEIVSLPRGFKNREVLFPSVITDKISLEFDRYAGESLFIANPQIAFVSKHYSDHYSIDLLKVQGVDLFFVGNTDTMEELCMAITDIGDVAGEPLKGRMLSIFIEALFIALDNVRCVQKLSIDKAKILSVSFYNSFYLPGRKSITDHLLKRMGINTCALLMPDDPRLDAFSVPISEEEIAYYDPDLLIILTDRADEIKNIIQAKGFLDLAKVRHNGSIAYISEKIQLSNSQAMALAYYDLNQALLKLKNE